MRLPGLLYCLYWIMCGLLLGHLSYCWVHNVFPIERMHNPLTGSTWTTDKANGPPVMHGGLLVGYVAWLLACKGVSNGGVPNFLTLWLVCTA